jgi:hypothetical protein
LNLLLKPGAFAVSPLQPRLIQGLQVPVGFLYGEHDWMSVNAGEEVVAALSARAEPVPTAFARVAQSGHQLALENPRQFNAELVAMVKQELARKEKGGKGKSNGTVRAHPTSSSSAAGTNGDAQMRQRSKKAS